MLPSSQGGGSSATTSSVVFSLTNDATYLAPDMYAAMKGDGYLWFGFQTGLNSAAYGLPIYTEVSTQQTNITRKSAPFASNAWVHVVCTVGLVRTSDTSTLAVRTYVNGAPPFHGRPSARSPLRLARR